MMRRALFVSSLVVGLAPLAQALEDAQVLPKGVRRLFVRSVHTQLSEQTTGSGSRIGLEQKLEKNVTFNDFIKNRSGLDRAELESFLLSEGINPDTVVGEITADLNGAVNAYVPTLALGVTDSFSFGILVPYFQAKTDVEAAFKATPAANDLATRLAQPETGRAGKAREAVTNINEVVDTLNDKLKRNGYKELGYWEDEGVGDIELRGKYQMVRTSILRTALQTSLTMPTGRTDDPDILTDIGFGDGQWDIGAGIMFDQLVGGPFFLNEYFKYTMQLPGRKEVRMKTDDESIEVPKKEVDFDLGDKIETGVSAQVAAQNGLLGGLGYIYYQKYRDKYVAPESQSQLEADTEQRAHIAEASIGYSTIPAYRRQAVAMPFSTALGYQYQLASNNMPVSNRVQFDLKLFF